MEAKTNRIRGFINTLKNNIYTGELPVSEIYTKTIGYNQRDTILETPDSSWESFKNGSHFGGRDVHACFKTTFTVDKGRENREIWMLLRTGVTDIWNTDNPQFLIYINGEIKCGMDMNHNELCLTKKSKEGESFEIGVYAYSNSLTASDYFKLIFTEKHPEVEKLYYDVKVPFDAAMENRPDSLSHIRTLEILNQVINKTNLIKVPSKEFYESVKTADAWLVENFYSKLSKTSDVTVHSIGHTHIDVAWKWPVRQTREKALRSFSTVLNYMDSFPEYRFMSSQPQLYQFVKEEAPEIYEKIKERVKEGRWETEGAMWLEADCNLTSGESLVRQIIHGKAFFKREFNKGDNKVLWLPDVFGYSAALPQILKKSGIDYFMTTKINWNEENKMPHDLFTWRGIDGSEVLTYFISTTNHKLYPELDPNPRFETTYNGRQNVTQVMGTWQRFSDKALTKDVLTCFGHGDGGGGPTREMLEENRRMSLGLPGMPVTKLTFVKDFFDLVQKNTSSKALPKWNGELYLEYHRGTYTSQAKNKRNNRFAEFRNEDAEWLSCFALTKDAGFAYPGEKLNSVWKLTLLNQFHDILPGSSIAEVYEVTDEDYKKIFDADKEMSMAAMAAVAGGTGERVAVFNPCSFARSALIETDQGPVLVSDIPSKGFKVVDLSNAQQNRMRAFEYKEREKKLFTPFYEVTFNESGEIVSLIDREAERELVKPGEALNSLVAFEDRPWEYDAWNIDSYYEEKSWKVDGLSRFEVIEDNAERLTIRIEREFLSSLISQDMAFYKSDRRIDFKTSVDWKEQQILLKSAFPVDILTNKCTCDIQFGNVERPTHRNTSWDTARFEFAAQKWVDVSEGDYGVSLLNNCKYGYDVLESTMRITLIKSGIFPDPNADKGMHVFTYSLLPHTGDFRKGRVIEEAYMLNRQVYTIPTMEKEGAFKSLVSVDTAGVFADTVKKAEDGDGFIVRVHEEYGARHRVKIDVSGLEICEAKETALLENEIESNAVFAEGIIETEIKPYEIKTFRLR